MIKVNQQPGITWNNRVMLFAMYPVAWWLKLCGFILSFRWRIYYRMGEDCDNFVTLPLQTFTASGERIKPTASGER